MRFHLAACVSALAILTSPVSAGETGDLEILQSFADDFEKDSALTRASMFGVKVGSDFYTIDAMPADGEKPARVSVTAGEPASPTFYFTVEDSKWLGKVSRGDVNALTSMAKAFSSDYAPMDVETMDGFQPTEDFGEWIVPFIFHFWTKGFPEIVPYGPDMTRETHGTNAGVFYYQPGLRSGWFDVRPGQHVNADEKSRTNPFPSMFIMIEGDLTARINGVDRPFRNGEMMFIPAGVSHEFINRGKKPARGFLFMFGDGA